MINHEVAVSREPVARGTRTGTDKIWWTEALIAAQLSDLWFDPEDTDQIYGLLEIVREMHGVEPPRDDQWLNRRLWAIAHYEEFEADPDENEELLLRTAKKGE